MNRCSAVSAWVICSCLIDGFGHCVARRCHLFQEVEPRLLTVEDARYISVGGLHGCLRVGASYALQVLESIECARNNHSKWVGASLPRHKKWAIVHCWLIVAIERSKQNGSAKSITISSSELGAAWRRTCFDGWNFFISMSCFFFEGILLGKEDLSLFD